MLKQFENPEAVRPNFLPNLKFLSKFWDHILFVFFQISNFCLNFETIFCFFFLPNLKFLSKFWDHIFFSPKSQIFVYILRPYFVSELVDIHKANNLHQISSQIQFQTASVVLVGTHPVWLDLSLNTYDWRHRTHPASFRRPESDRIADYNLWSDKLVLGILRLPVTCLGPSKHPEWHAQPGC